MPSAPEPVIPPPATPGELIPADAAAGGPGGDVETSRALRLVARREHELLALSELSQELTISLDLYGVADLVLFNLMGQLGTSRAALWLISDDDRRAPVLLRSYGIEKRMAIALGSASAPWLLERLEGEKRIILASELGELSDTSTSWLVRQEAIALFAPIFTRGELLGILAVGARVGFGGYGPVELQVLQTSLGMVGVALHNTKLYNRLLENNRKLRLANETLMELDRLKSEFLNNVNHELRTPLTVVIATLHCLLDAERPGTQTHEFLKVALGESQNLKGLLENLLEFSAAQKDRLDLQFETGDVSIHLRAYYEERLPGVTQGLREFTFHASPEVPSAQFDRHRLLQVVDALVDNAVKFTSPGAHIALRISVVEVDGARRVRIDIADDGPGIPPERISALFHSFRQVDGSATRKVGGMGLGLALAKELAEKMNGALAVTSEIGAGSTFSLFLPAV